MRSLTIIKNPNAEGVKTANDDLRSVCEKILDNWRAFTGVQIGIAATMVNFANPAEMLSGKQLYRLQQAQKIIDSLSV